MKIGKLKDLNFGFKNEEFVKQILTDLHPNQKVEYHKGNFHPFDIKVLDPIVKDKIDNEYELKSRRIYSTTYDSLMFGENKLRYVEKKFDQEGGNYTFLWYCTKDKKLLAWDWKKGTTEYTLGMGQNKKRNEKAKKCVYVKTADMYEICYLT